MKISIALVLLVLTLVGYLLEHRHWTGYGYLGGYEPQHLLVIGRFLFLKRCRDAARSEIKRSQESEWFYECGLNCLDGRCEKMAQ